MLILESRIHVSEFVNTKWSKHFDGSSNNWKQRQREQYIANQQDNWDAETRLFQKIWQRMLVIYIFGILLCGLFGVTSSSWFLQHHCPCFCLFFYFLFFATWTISKQLNLSFLYYCGKYCSLLPDNWECMLLLKTCYLISWNMMKILSLHWGRCIYLRMPGT